MGGSAAAAPPPCPPTSSSAGIIRLMVIRFARPASPRTVLGAFQAAEVAELEPDHDEEDGQHEERDRGALAEQAGGPPDLIGVGGEQVGGVGGAAAGQHVDELEVGEGLD